MADKETALAILQAALAVGALLLVFAGFLFGRAESTYNANRSNRLRWLARLALLPLLSSVFCSWVSVWVVQGSMWASDYLLWVFKGVLAITAIYAIIAIAES